MPSFDIVSKTDPAEVENAIANLMRELATRFDFKGSKSTVEIEDGIVTINADDDLKLKQLQELLQGHVARRKLDARILDYQTPENAAGQSVRQKVLIREGIDKELAKRIVKDVKGTKIKVQVAIQGDELRVTGKKRDDLQEVMAFVKGLDADRPLQFTNFRD
jgi:hypothetical protein